MLSTANGRLAAIALTSISGSSVLRSAKTKATRSRTPTTIEPIVRASPHPQTGGLLDPEHRQRHPGHDQHRTAYVDAGRVLDVAELREVDLGEGQDRRPAR